MRTVATDDDHEPRRFGVYAAVALSGIGGLAATLADRSVTTNLKRKRPGEKITKFRLKHIAHLHELRRRIVRWVADHEERIAEREPEMPEAIVDREADNWEVLFAIADEAGGEWPQRARKAALAAHGAETDDDLSLLEVLLVDIHTAFAGKAEISSADLVGKLTRMIGHPWREMGKSGKQLTQNKLARMLNGLRLGIAPRMTGPKDKRVSGYAQAQFKEAFERYLPSEGDSNLTTSHQAANTGTSDDFKPHTKGDGCEVGKREKSNNDGLVRGCEVGKGGKRKRIKLPGFAGVVIH
jgi:hypothetical protein